eukprot:2516884-Pleurochrysis_carterae.AAC.3
MKALDEKNARTFELSAVDEQNRIESQDDLRPECPTLARHTRAQGARPNARDRTRWTASRRVCRRWEVCLQTAYDCANGAEVQSATCETHPLTSLLCSAPAQAGTL